MRRTRYICVTSIASILLFTAPAALVTVNNPFVTFTVTAPL